MHVNGVNLYVEDTGGDHPETIVFSHGLLFSGRMFEAQIKVLKDRYRCISYDHRGQANSEVTAAGYDMDTLTDDACQLIQSLGAAPCHFVGLSMGGFVGLRLAIRHPQLLKSLTLIETSADPEPRENLPRYRMLNLIARWIGLWSASRPVMQIMFGQNFLNDPNRAAERAKWKQHIISHDRIGITKAVKGVIEREGVADNLHRITVPTLIIVGDQDVALGPENSERMQARIPNSKLVVIPGAGHSSTIEEPQGVNEAILSFLESLDS